uniref:Uncharacterized protein n=1 Tax=Percolomonas cosmopolitus TaxID=63605 RepID=A0A7S1KPG4_9EUKA|mmetsp:Transcript_2992/g.11449  ORF Transcript_2992/g.11449 Transcript_2992/m.11449 type:complete len:308 (+) Transcript_2992:22-945(+)|eukprot:CAMPEP_0117443258 /NCGR_PEP_ID=MMETSP0759-20121206/4598_1 /TAXON_ID=63605 /ORGANISM="Percolomonas cosmopolitus, Strain WS" /LENGTH=307 /DNA_ID=CAMNT_0005235219 /DNA_START=9 /DNA_END=932 /DNA_ORIENTATION=+
MSSSIRFPHHHHTSQPNSSPSPFTILQLLPENRNDISLYTPHQQPKHPQILFRKESRLLESLEKTVKKRVKGQQLPSLERLNGANRVGLTKNTDVFNGGGESSSLETPLRRSFSTHSPFRLSQRSKSLSVSPPKRLSPISKRSRSVSMLDSSMEQPQHSGQPPSLSPKKPAFSSSSSTHSSPFIQRHMQQYFICERCGFTVQKDEMRFHHCVPEDRSPEEIKRIEKERRLDSILHGHKWTTNKDTERSEQKRGRGDSGSSLHHLTNPLAYTMEDELDLRHLKRANEKKASLDRAALLKKAQQHKQHG